MRAALFGLVVAIAPLAACGNVLAKNNPCGGEYPAEGEAEVLGAHVRGTLASDANEADAFDADGKGADGDGTCSVFASGLAPADGTGIVHVSVSCRGVIANVAVPDVRELAAGATAPATVTIENGASGQMEGSACRDVTTTLTIASAQGKKADSAPYVTPDFLRAVTVDFDDTADGAPPGCARRVALHARIELAASNYAQAMQRGEDHCPALPSK